MKKKLFSLILTLLMIAPSLASCAETGSDETAETGSAAVETTEEAIETEPELSDGLGNPQFNGYEFRILSYNNDANFEVAKRVMYDDYTGNPVNDALRESTLYLEDRFDVKILSTPAVNAETVQSIVLTTVNAGDNAFDIQINHDGITFNTARSGAFYNMLNVDQFDFTKPWWPSHAVDALSFCNTLYCASNYISYLGLHWTRAVMVNKDYAERLNLAIPYDKVREGTWTLDAMLSYIEGTSNDTNGNGSIDAEDDIGFCTGSQTWYCLQESMDIPVYRRDPENNVYIDFDIDKVDTYVAKLRSLIGSQDYINAGGTGETIFNQGTALLCYGQIGDAYDIYSAADFSYAFLPTPKFNEIQNSYINCCTDCPWAIPKTVSEEQLDIIGTICEAMACYNYQNVLPIYFDVAMKSRMADQPDDAEMLQLIADTRTISFSYSYGMYFNNLIGDLGTSNAEVASYHKKQIKAAQKTLDKMIQSYEDMKALEQ